MTNKILFTTYIACLSENPVIQMKTTGMAGSQEAPMAKGE